MAKKEPEQMNKEEMLREIGRLKKDELQSLVHSIRGSAPERATMKKAAPEVEPEE